MSDPTGRDLGARRRAAPASAAGEADDHSPESNVERGSVAVRREERAYEVGGSKIDVAQLALMLAEHLKPPEVEKPFFGELADDWFQFIRTRRVAPDNEERHIRRLKDLFLETEASLTAAMVQEQIEKQKDYSPSSRNKLRGTGKLIIEYAQAKERWVKPNPFDQVKREKEERREYELLTLPELYKVQQYLRPDRLRLFRVALHMGLRPGELMGLKVEHVDFKKLVVHVERSRDRDETKTGVDRDVPIHPGCYTDLLDACVAAKGDLVFGNSYDGDMQSKDTKLCKILRTAMKKAKVGLLGFKLACRRPGCKHVETVKVDELHGNKRPRCPKCDFKLWIEPLAKKVRWYDLRHMCATFHHAANANDVCVSLALGHSLSEETTTKKTYVHPTQATMQAELSKWKLPRAPVCQTELPLTCE